MRMTEQELEAIQNKRNNAQKRTLQLDKSKSDAMVLGRLKQGAMNKTERKYKDHLESKKMKGEIIGLHGSQRFPHYNIQFSGGSMSKKLGVANYILQITKPRSCSEVLND